MTPPANGSSARLRVESAGPHVTLQDGGRRGHMRFGVPASGPMDRLAHAAANAVLGNEVGATAVEVSSAGLALVCRDGAVDVAVVGGGFAVHHPRGTSTSWTAVQLREGEQLDVRGGPDGSWTYVTFAGVLRARRWLGASATHALSGLGGGAVSGGDELVVEDARHEPWRLGEVPPPRDRTAGSDAAFRCVLGPQDRHFSSDAVDRLLTSAWRVSPARDRMGVRLDGSTLELREGLSLPSQPVVRGAIQVAGDGVPTVLLADHQTTGGYPKIATVVDADQDRLAQLRPGGVVRFTAVTPGEAIAATRARHTAQDRYLATLRRPGRTLAHRLAATNLVDGVVSGTA